MNKYDYLTIVSRKVDIGIIILLLIIIGGIYFYGISIYFLVIPIALYIGVSVVGSYNISLGYYFHSYCRSQSSKKEIAITFDDGPHPEITPKLISLLNKNNVNATFFCIGEKAYDYHEITANIFNSGHIVGNHSFKHSKFFDLMTPTKMRKEIVDTNEIIANITGSTPLLFRPPYGVTNPMLRSALKKTNMFSIGWSLRSFDTIKDTDEVLKKLKKSTKPGDIILFHDTNPNIVSIIEDYLFWLRENKYNIVSLSELLNIQVYES